MHWFLSSSLNDSQLDVNRIFLGLIFTYMVFFASRELIKSRLTVILPMSLTKSLLTRSDRNRRNQKIQKKVVRCERRSLSHNQVTNENIINVNGQTHIVHCKTCYYHSSAVVIHYSKLVLTNKFPECMIKNVAYYSTSTNRLFEYILSNIN
jgi:hypothetical protein